MISALHDVSHLFPWFFPLVAFVFGACIGSFLNVVIYRVPANQSIVSPPSHCACGKPIAWYDNIPILSWLILGGKARCCGRPFSFRYPAIEALTGILFTVCWLLHSPAVAACGFVFISCLICATFIDLDHMIIPDAFTIGLGCVGVVLSAMVPLLHVNPSGNFVVDSVRSATDSLQGLFIGSGLVLWIGLVAEVLLKKEAMGFGDVKFVGAIGAFCGWKGAVISIFGGAVVGSFWFALVVLFQVVTGKKQTQALPSETPEGEATPLGFGVHVPFGPMLAIAALLYFLFLSRWCEIWFQQFGELF